MDQNHSRLKYVRARQSAVGVAVLIAAWLMLGSGPAADAQSSCSNAIVCENSKPGNPDTEWDINGAGDPSIQGFTTDISVNKGETVHFKVNTDATAYRLDIYRMGYYGGMGARKVASVTPTVHLPQPQPACLTDPSTGLIDCGNWAESASWTVPSNATSGIYFAKLVRTDGVSRASHIVFIVRDDSGGSDLLFQTSDTTWQAYNTYGGNSLYEGGPGPGPPGIGGGRAYEVSYNRPFNTRANRPEDWVFYAEYPMVRWLEANGYNVSYFTGVDSDRRGAEIREHKVFLAVGHDEYWSGQQRANVETARGAGVHLAFFSGNETFWKIRWDTSIDGSGTPYRTLVSYKETHADAKIDPVSTVWTGTWSDPRFSPPADGGRPQNALTGTTFTVNCCTSDITVPQAYGQMRFWRHTSVATLGSGQVATLGFNTLGYEWDEDLDDGVRPPGLMRLSSTTVDVPLHLLDYGSTYGPGTATHHLMLYRHSSGALVFGAGTVQWSWGLDGIHDDSQYASSDVTDMDMQQATVNLFADMGVQPGTLQPGLVAASASTDTAPPISTITAPAAGSTVQSGQLVTITGTASDAGGGVVGGVEVSVDGGVTWHPATGRATWSYTWTPGLQGSVTIMSRAVDDSGNLESSPDSVTVSVQGKTCPCSLWSNATTPTVTATSDPGAVELGVKFQASLAGYITGLRFYKGTTNTGTHVGHLWTSSGTLLASATFTNESASGWQQVQFSSPVAISANTTYVASYHTTVGHYAVNSGYFATAGFANPPLQALAIGPVNGGNGVYLYGASGFPTQTFNAANYWVDVIFNTTGTSTPTVLGTSQPDGATGIDPGTSITASFSEAMDPSTITTTTVQLRDPSGTLVPATVSYNSATATVTLTPTAPLAFSTIYTVTIVGGANGVKDLAGNPLGANVTWSFTTAAKPTCPCSLWSNATTPTVTATSDPSAVELGVKFQASLAGYITGLRFYKGATNTGTHVGHLWTSSGTLLASATFTNESASGWQQVQFSSPVAISANTTYVASYHTTVGHYAYDSAYLASGFTNYPLRALADGTNGGNGVYLYGASGFPTQTFNATNYWVDVVFALPTPPGTFLDTTVAAFSAGTPDVNTSIAQTDDGEVILAPSVGAEFSGTALPAGWTSSAWSTGGTASVANGLLTVDGAIAGTVPLFGPGRSLEFVATFNGDAYQHVGFAVDFNDALWAIFSTGIGGNLYARTNAGSASTDTPLGSNWLGARHRYRIDWNVSNLVYSIDGTVVATHAIAITSSMRPLVSDFTVGGGSIVVDWLRLTPYAASGTFLSRVFDGVGTVLWGTVTWTSNLPSGTSLVISVRQGNTPTPDSTWTPFTTIASSGATIGGNSRYLQYQAQLATTTAGQTPVLQDVTITKSAGGS